MSQQPDNWRAYDHAGTARAEVQRPTYVVGVDHGSDDGACWQLWERHTNGAMTLVAMADQPPANTIEGFYHDRAVGYQKEAIKLRELVEVYQQIEASAREEARVAVEEAKGWRECFVRAIESTCDLRVAVIALLLGLRGGMSSAQLAVTVARAQAALDITAGDPAVQETAASRARADGEIGLLVRIVSAASELPIQQLAALAALDHQREAMTKVYALGLALDAMTPGFVASQTETVTWRALDNLGPSTLAQEAVAQEGGAQ